MSGTTRLKIYNGALMLCGEQSLSSLSENTASRRYLDEVWDNDGVRYCLEMGEWQFAMRTQEIYHDTDLSDQFGYVYGFQKDTDWVATHAVCSDEYFTTPLLQYADEVGYIYADIEPIYVKFTSDNASYGGDLSKWPQSFCDYVDAYFASKIIYRLNANENRITFLFGRPGDTAGGELGRRLKVAKSRAGLTQPTKFPAAGSWSKARNGRSKGPMGDGGTSGGLVG